MGRAVSKNFHLHPRVGGYKNNNHNDDDDVPLNHITAAEMLNARVWASKQNRFVSFHFISLLYVFVRICLQTMEQCGPATEMPKNSRKDHKGKTVVAASFRSPITPRPQLQQILG